MKKDRKVKLKLRADHTEYLLVFLHTWWQTALAEAQGLPKGEDFESLTAAMASYIDSAVVALEACPHCCQVPPSRTAYDKGQFTPCEHCNEQEQELGE